MPYEIDIGDDTTLWKSSGPGGGNPRVNPPGRGVGGTGSSGGGGGGGMFDAGQERMAGFDPYGEQRRRMARAFGRGPMSLGGQQPQAPQRIDPQMIQRILAMLGGGF